MRKAFLIVLGLCFAAASPVLAFHDGGVAACEGCHTMHNSEDGQPVDPDSPNGNPWLLRDETPSDVCLRCHATRLGAVFGADPLNPPTLIGGGNFTYLLEDNVNDGHNGASNPIPGYAAGHSINAPSKGVGPDAILTQAPGGSFPASVLGCTSCHDPHGTEDFRMLYGAGRVVQDGVATFLNPAPEAVGLSISDPVGETNSNHTAYHSGMSAWCANCHGDYHQQDNGSKLIHKSGQTMGATVATIYDLYNGTADITGGTHADAYLAAVAFEDPAMTTTSTAGPVAGSQVSCISCHRAHATSARNAGRWDFQVTLLDEDGHESGAYAIPNPYGDDDQRSLCNKCHKKDEFDHIATP